MAIKFTPDSNINFTPVNFTPDAPEVPKYVTKNPVEGLEIGLLRAARPVLQPAVAVRGMLPKQIGGFGLSPSESWRQAGEMKKYFMDNVSAEGFVPQLAKGAGELGGFLKMYGPAMEGGQAVARGAGGLLEKGLGRLGVANAGKFAAPLRAPITQFTTGLGTAGAAQEALDIGDNRVSPGRAFMESAKQAPSIYLSGKLGSTVGQKALGGLTKYGSRIGSAAGGAAYGYTTAPEGEKLSSAVLYGGLSGKYPSTSFGARTQAELYHKAASIYRDVLRPTQGEVKSIEIRKGGNINDYYALAAKEKLPITQGPNKTLDTEEARKLLSQKIKDSGDQLTEILKADPTKRFNLTKMGSAVKRNINQQYNNAQEAQSAVGDVDNYISAEIQRYGEMVDASTLNRIKQGMWSQGYNTLRPTSKESARRIGFAARKLIEKNYPDQNIQELNKRTGDYLTLNTLLENAQGRVIKGGRLGEYVFRSTGAIAGGLAGQAIPIPGVGAAVGATGGQWAGRKIANAVFSPERAISEAGKKVTQAERMSQELPIDKFVNELKPKLQEFFSRPEARQWVLSEVGRNEPFKAELVPQRALPAPAFQQREALPAPQQFKSLPYREGAVEKGGIVFGKGFQAKIGAQRRGQISQKVAHILRTTPPQNIPKTIESLPLAEKNAAKQFMRELWQKLQNESGQAVFGREEPQKPVFGVKPESPAKQPIAQPGEIPQSKVGIVAPSPIPEFKGYKDITTKNARTTQRANIRFYEKEVARYLKRIAPDTKLITDKQGVTWNELSVPKEAKSRAVEAFGIAAATTAGLASQAQAKENNIQSGQASTYGWGEKLNKHTFSGEVFNPEGLTAAMRDVPMGTKIKVTDKKTKKSVTLTVNDGGPNIRTKRVVDLSKGAWKALGYNKAGLADVDVEIIKLGTGKKFHQ